MIRRNIERATFDQLTQQLLSTPDRLRYLELYKQTLNSSQSSKPVLENQMLNMALPKQRQNRLFHALKLRIKRSLNIHKCRE